jgi:hypothetical protein
VYEVLALQAKANVSDDQGLIEMLSNNIDYFRAKPEFSQKLRAHPQPCDCQDRSVFYPFDAQTALISTRLKIDPKWVL